MKINLTQADAALVIESVPYISYEHLLEYCSRVDIEYLKLDEMPYYLDIIDKQIIEQLHRLNKR